MSRSSIIWRIVGIFVLLAVLAVAGTFVYQAGYTQGVAHSALVTTASGGSAPAPVPMPYPYYGYYPGMWMNPFIGFFPFGCLIGFFLICLFFFAMRMIFFPRRWGRHGWRHHGYGPWGGPPWEDDEGPGGEGQGKGQSGPTRTA